MGKSDKTHKTVSTMQEIKIDFYSEFDEDTEVTLSFQTDEYRKTISIWHFYFENIMDKMEEIEDESLCFYHLYRHLIGWERDGTWKIPNLDCALLQFKGIELSPDLRTNTMYFNAECRILDEIIQMISEAIEKKVDVYISQTT
jgi:hypothetical protein